MPGGLLIKRCLEQQSKHQNISSKISQAEKPLQSVEEMSPSQNQQAKGTAPAGEGSGFCIWSKQNKKSFSNTLNINGWGGRRKLGDS